ncbi:hypothetical protein ANN_03666 [Periplaneta americana]|uniref:Per a allergen n=1 Tax=Periplaneta americana TaxID=6978 RepID=A0ABQ8U2Q3_PERAM|nr:hypothetical protein ANN_03666 [Periplaneta americana]
MTQSDIRLKIERKPWETQTRYSVQAGIVPTSERSFGSPDKRYVNGDEEDEMGYLRDRVYHDLLADKDDLINKIRATSGTITPEMLLRMREGLMRRITMCAEQEGAYCSI